MKWIGVKSDISLIEYFKECFTIDSDGNLYWKVRPNSHFKSDRDTKIFNSQFSNKLAGHVKKGRYTFYRRVKVLGSTIEAHTICWGLYYEKFPMGHIDHIDGNGLNNHKTNLRDSGNEKNKQMYVNNLSGVVGVFWSINKNRWIATGRNEQLGSFTNIFDAACVRKSWEINNGYTPRKRN